MKVIEKISQNNIDINKPSTTIVFLGDSVTQGSFYDKPDYEAVYHNRIKKKLNFLFPRAVVNIINAGIGGTTAIVGAERLERDVISRNPDLCVVCFGLNDMGEDEHAIKVYTDALSEIFEKLTNYGCEIIFMTPNMMATRISDSIPEIWRHRADDKIHVMTSGLMDKFMNAAVETAKKHNVPVCDCYSKWQKLAKMGVDTTALLANGLNHPVKEMHELFANSLLEMMFE